MSSGRILIVDDDPQIRRVLRTTLIAQGYEVKDARNGEEALECVREGKLELIILDMNMPGLSGIEICRSIRSTSDVAIIMLTVRDSEADKVAALDAGADDYVTKPFGIEELLARVRANLRRVPTPEPEVGGVLDEGDFHIDIAAHQATIRGKEVRLTPKEFEVLVYLARHSGKVVPHRALLSAVWGPNATEQPEYLRVFIGQLRKKLEADASSPRYIVTEPWIGYRFEPGR